MRFKINVTTDDRNKKSDKKEINLKQKNVKKRGNQCDETRVKMDF